MNRRRTKRLILSILILTILLPQSSSFYSFAARPIRLMVDGKDITSKASPIIERGRTLVPIRFVAEELGAKGGGKSEERRVIIEKGDRLVDLKIGSYLVMAMDGKRTIF